MSSKEVIVVIHWPDGKVPTRVPENLREGEILLPELIGRPVFEATGAIRKIFGRYGISILVCTVRLNGRKIDLGSKCELKAGSRLEFAWEPKAKLKK